MIVCRIFCFKLLIFQQQLSLIGLFLILKKGISKILYALKFYQYVLICLLCINLFINNSINSLHFALFLPNLDQ